MTYESRFTETFTRVLTEQCLIDVQEYEKAVPSEIVFTFKRMEENFLYFEIIRLAALQVLPNRIKRYGVLLDDKSDNAEVRVQLRYAANRRQRKLMDTAGEKPYDIKPKRRKRK